MLQLATDVDSFARQLFEPLTMQTIHWLTSSRDGGASPAVVRYRPTNRSTMQDAAWMVWIFSALRCRRMVSAGAVGACPL